MEGRRKDGMRGGGIRTEFRGTKARRHGDTAECSSEGGDGVGGKEEFEGNEEKGDSAGGKGILMDGGGEEDEEDRRNEGYEQLMLAGSVKGENAEDSGKKEDAGDGTGRVREEFPRVFQDEFGNLEWMSIVDERFTPVVHEEGIPLGTDGEEIEDEEGDDDGEVNEEIPRQVSGWAADELGEQGEADGSEDEGSGVGEPEGQGSGKGRVDEAAGWRGGLSGKGNEQKNDGDENVAAILLEGGGLSDELVGEGQEGNGPEGSERREQVAGQASK